MAAYATFCARSVHEKRIALMTSIGVTNRDGSYNRSTEAHDWKRRSERLARASGLPYTIVRPGWFDYNGPNEHQLVLLQGDTRQAGNSSGGVIARRQIAEVLVHSLNSDQAERKTFESSPRQAQRQSTSIRCLPLLMRIRKTHWTEYATRQTNRWKTSRTVYVVTSMLSWPIDPRSEVYISKMTTLVTTSAALQTKLRLIQALRRIASPTLLYTTHAMIPVTAR